MEKGQEGRGERGRRGREGEREREVGGRGGGGERGRERGEEGEGSYLSIYSSSCVLANLSSMLVNLRCGINSNRGNASLSGEVGVTMLLSMGVAWLLSPLEAIKVGDGGLPYRGGGVSEGEGRGQCHSLCSCFPKLVSTKGHQKLHSYCVI